MVKVSHTLVPSIAGKSQIPNLSSEPRSFQHNKHYNFLCSKSGIYTLKWAAPTKASCYVTSTTSNRAQQYGLSKPWQLSATWDQYKVFRSYWASTAKSSIHRFRITTALPIDHPKCSTRLKLAVPPVISGRLQGGLQGHFHVLWLESPCCLLACCWSLENRVLRLLCHLFSTED